MQTTSLKPELTTGMQIVCSKAELIKGIQTVQAAVSTKSTLPILSNILLETQTNQLKLASTDLQVGVRCLINAEKNGSDSKRLFILLVACITVV